MRVLLVFPELSRTKYDFIGISEDECLELEYLSAVLKEASHDVMIIDGQIQKINVAKAIKTFKPEAVYLCGRTRQENFMLEYCALAKEYDPALTTIIGGMHAQLCYERLYDSNVDFIIKTFDPYTIIEVLRGNTQADSISYRVGQEWISNPTKPFDASRLPLPDRSFFDAHPDSYRYLELEHAAWVRTAYSCPFHCEFCHRNKLNVGRYSTRSIADVLNEIKNINATNIYICDDDFLISRNRVAEFVRLIREQGVNKKYICYGRADFIAKNPSLMRELKNIGLHYCLVGLEATDDTNLRRYNKRSDVDSNVRAIEICNDLDIKLMGIFIADLDFRPGDFNNLYKWIVDHQLKHVAVTIYTPEMCTPDFDRYRDRMITDNPSHWDYLHVVAKPTHISVKHFYFCYYKLLFRLLLRARRDGIYDFLDYRSFFWDFLRGMFVKRKNDNE